MKTVLVTGGNRGIGLEICRQLDKLGYLVILGSRDLKNGEKAAKALSKNVIVKQLDVTNEESIQNLFKYVKSNYKKLDVLINNAGLGANYKSNENQALTNVKNIVKTKFNGLRQMAKAIKPLLQNTGIINQTNCAKDILLEDVKYLMETNFYGTWRMIQIFIPLLIKSEDGRIINISSGMGQLESLTGDYSGYRLSKSSLNALTIMFSNELLGKIKVNAMCPGWVKTDMGGPDAPLTVSQGADTAVWLTTEKEIPTGKFFKERKEINW